MDAQTAFLERLRPPGGKRSSKRDLIVNAFLHQDGHLSADDLVDLLRQDGQKISRATVYRTLQWMVDAGIARKVDFGEGRFDAARGARDRGAHRGDPGGVPGDPGVPASARHGSSNFPAHMHTHASRSQ